MDESLMTHFDCDAILFDLDGVLINSNAAVECCWRQWSAQHGLDAEAILHLSHGRPTVETIRLVAPHLSAEAEAERLNQAAATDYEGVTEVVGVAALIAQIPPDRWAIVTSGNRPIATNRLRYMGLPLPNVLITSDDVTQGKPHPEGYLQAAQQLRFAPDRCLVVEDAIAGVKAARAVGMPVIAVTTTYSAHQLVEAGATAQLSAMALLSVGFENKIGDRSHLRVTLNAAG